MSHNQWSAVRINYPVKRTVNCCTPIACGSWHPHNACDRQPDQHVCVLPRGVVFWYWTFARNCIFTVKVLHARVGSAKLKVEKYLHLTNYWWLQENSSLQKARSTEGVLMWKTRAVFEMKKINKPHSQPFSLNSVINGAFR